MRRINYYLRNGLILVVVFLIGLLWLKLMMDIIILNLMVNSYLNNGLINVGILRKDLEQLNWMVNGIC